ncbi:MAG TPA: ABC transporter ATP-binding protein [Hyphomicrobiaceae bacterium]|nr:ABC transporter ATP-binding protein [Hyphomicrobiaceae bacterium]
MSSLAAERQPRLAAQTTGGDIAVKLRDVTKTFGEVHALKDATLCVRRGELMTLLGPSGCGKSTLLNLIAGFLTPDRGELEIDGHRVTDIPPYKREIGMVFQNYALFPHMSAADNVGYGLRMRRLAKREVERRVADALALVRLSGIENRRPHQLSGGQQQRVALARALVISPKVLLLDEPLSALDRSLRASMQVEIKEIQRQLGVTALFVTHDQSEALSLSDRIAVMFDGQIRQIGTPADIYRRPSDRFVASFVGDVNVLRARLGSIDQTTATISLGAQSIPVATGPLAGSKPGDPVDLFVRPEQLRLSATGEPMAAQGTVTTHIYQGAHVDLYVLSPVASGGRLLVRSAEPDAITRWPVGAVVGVTVSGADAMAFAPQDDKP